LTPGVEAGVDVLLRDSRSILDASVGLITNQSAVTKDLTPTVEALHSHRDIRLTALYSPEHGLYGDIQDAVPIEHHTDPETGLPVYSLYGETRRPMGEMLEGVDLLLFDLQDVGARFYTYASTLTYALEAAAEVAIPLILLDRPNPITGVHVEGKILEPGYESFIGLHRIPIRHGLTLGELALLANEAIGAELRIIPIEGWRRDMWFDETSLPWVPPSPNMPTMDTAIVYPGTCLFEGTNLSEGRGTTKPFELIGAPWINPHRWAGHLNSLGLPGVRFRPCHFKPTFSKHAGERCGGVQIHVLDRERFKPVETALHMLQSLMELWPEELRWLPSEGMIPLIDLLYGGAELRMALERGLPVEEVVEGWGEDLDRYRERLDGILLYE
jgi:uncharacterized protein YbbC (DUF1343 family)